MISLFSSTKLDVDTTTLYDKTPSAESRGRETLQKKWPEKLRQAQTRAERGPKANLGRLSIPLIMTRANHVGLPTAYSPNTAWPGF